MKTDIQALKDFAVRNGLSFENISRKIGIDPSTFYRKVGSDGEKFTIGEVHRMIEELPMSQEEAVSIFLSDNSQ